MNKIPEQFENPNGLHNRYLIQKIVKRETQISPSLRSVDWVLVNPERDAEYFVMRLDEGGSDIEHIKACRIGVHAYADAIKHHLPELAKDLKERYPIL